jgi:hypothetical protein
MIVGQYHLVAYLMNGIRVERDAALVPFRHPDDQSPDVLDSSDQPST